MKENYMTKKGEFEAFLAQIDKSRRKYEDLEKKQESFNIFSTLHKANDERRLHSRYIAALLQPKGSHGNKDLFLKNFIQVVGEQLENYWKKNDLKGLVDINIQFNNFLDEETFNLIDENNQIKAIDNLWPEVLEFVAKLEND
jgi:hypothetical protein